ncbi:uncharacterized protein LOC135197029 isoform X2 [Macrobrachium nipponense]|uniref:uncharacterized protein LOC135197029 isoform X2 n=1 Tax=Macrobrachium nipponense TaxID=159736 RepID=UPI0030C878DA
MEWLRDASFLLVMMMMMMATIFPACAPKRSSRLLLSSIPEVCQSAKVNLEAGQMAWIVSPGSKVPGVIDGTQGICKWTIKVPAGYGIELEVVRFRLRNSRHCQVTNVQIVPRLSVPRQVNRPLTRFCGRGPRSKIWRTTYSEIDLEYAGLRDQGHLGQIQGNSSTENELLHQEQRPEAHSRPHGRSRPSTAEKLDKIKALQRYYQKKRQEQERDDPQGYQQRLAQTKQFHGFKRRHDGGSDNRRFYRHSNHTGNSVHHEEDDNTIFVIDDEHFLYDNDSQVYGSFSVHPKSTYLRLFSAGEPAWISGNELNSSETKYEEYLNVLGELSKASRKLGRSRKKVKQNNKKAKKKKSQFESGHLVGDSTERVTRSARPRRRTTRRRAKTRSYRTQYYTVSLGRPRTTRKQYRVSIAKHDEPSSTEHASPHDPQRPTETHYFRSREHNEIIPEKPTKLSFVGESKEMFTPKMSHHNPTSSSSSSSLISKEPEDLSGSKGTKKESFVIKVSAFQSSCGGSITAEKGRFASPGYPKKMGGKRSCLWNFQTSGETSWKLECIHFRIRKSPRCRRDHIAIRINDAEWTRYCGREGPSLTLTSSHSSKVDVALNTFRNSSARVICSWETVSLGFRHSSYQRYWSYNLTRIPATTPSTTTTTTTTTTPSTKLIAKPSWSCPDYVHLNKEHTMCKPTPATCAIYQQGLTVTDQQQILKSHNDYRAKVARGEESGGLPGPQYSASDMQQLSWNGELAQVAQAWASACPDYHDCHECRKLLSRSYYVGQNIFYEWSSSNPGPVWETAVRLWYEEVKYVPNYLVKDFRVMNHAVIGHYTQLVWADTKEIGCGAAYHDCTKVFRGRSWKLKCKIYVCNYGPTGNYVRKPMYTIGPPASACPDGSAPSREYPGLCTTQ